MVEWISHRCQFALGAEFVRPLITPTVINKFNLIAVSLFGLSGLIGLPKIFFGVV